MSLLKILHILSTCINFTEIPHSLIGSYQVIHRSCFQGFANYKMELFEKRLAFPVVGIDLSYSDSSMIFCDWLLLGGKYLIFHFSYLSLRVSLTLRERKNISCCQTLKGQRCTGCLRESVKAISSLISHLVANNPRGIPNGLCPR